MRRTTFGLVAWAVLAAAGAIGPLSSQPAPGPQGPEAASDRQQLWLIPSSVPNLLMRATVFRPAGPGPFPLAVVNHGSTQNQAKRLDYPTPVFGVISRWLVAHGYAVVVPQRPGHGDTGGPYLEDQHGCDDAAYGPSGIATAASISAAIDYMAAEPFVRRNAVAVLGQSAGGWGGLALASTNPPMVRAVVNFAGGRGGRVDEKPDNNCAPDALVAAAAVFGRTARIPSLWIYAENDSYFPPPLSKRMAAAYRTAGGDVDFRLVGPFKNDGHLLMESPDGVAIWEPLVAPFLARNR